MICAAHGCWMRDAGRVSQPLNWPNGAARGGGRRHLAATDRHRASCVCRTTWRSRVTFHAGDMLDAKLGQFDAVIAMDSLIYYTASDIGAALAALEPRVSGPVVFTVAPRTPALMAMWYAGKAFPRSDRSPVMIPHTHPLLAKAPRPLACAVCCAGRPGHQSGFYISEAMELRPMSALKHLSLKALPFADAASDDAADGPTSCACRCSRYRSAWPRVMLLGTLNRVMIVELSRARDDRGGDDRPAGSVGPLPRAAWASAPTRTAPPSGGNACPISGSARFGSLAAWPSCPLPCSCCRVARCHTIPFAGEVLAALAFLMTGLGMHMTQTAGLALASDRATDETRPRVVAMLYVMFLVGMGISALIIGGFSTITASLTLIRVVQGSAVVGAVAHLCRACGNKKA